LWSCGRETQWLTRIEEDLWRLEALERTFGVVLALRAAFQAEIDRGNRSGLG
jgi:hypothetical protein